MRFQTQVDVDADPETVWRVLIDVESWPKWTASMTSVQRLQGGEFGVGSSARVVQPKLKAAVYTVTECEAGRSFTWEMKTTGVQVRAGHLIEDLGGGRGRGTARGGAAGAGHAQRRAVGAVERDRRRAVRQADAAVRRHGDRGAEEGG